MPIQKICQTCGKEFNLKPYQEGSVSHCSSKCWSASKRETRKCEHCGIEFSWIKSQGKGKYCSVECFKHSKASKKQKPVARQPVFKICEECSKAFRIPPVRMETARFCSIKCKSVNLEYRAHQSQKQSREKSWRWVGAADRSSYVALKTRPPGSKVRYEHQRVMVDWLLEQSPNHPFLIYTKSGYGLHQDIEVHHIDRNTKNNSRENLLAVTKKAHAQIHHRGTKPNPWECWPSNPNVW